MQDTRPIESNNSESKSNQVLEVEKNDTLSLKSFDDSDLSFGIFSKCNGDNPNISMINTLNLSSTESNVSEKKISSILRENMKLKEMFRNKNSSTRKQLSAVIVLHKEIQQICENYKQRFLEVIDFVDQIQRDNSTLKATSMEDEGEEEDKVPTTRELNLIGKLRDLSQRLKNSEENYSRSQLQLKDAESEFTIEVNNFKETLQKFQDELKILKEKVTSSWLSDLLSSVKNELETKYLTELTSILKQSLDEKKLIETESEESNNCKEKLHQLFKCFTKYCADSLNVENFPEECSNIIHAIKNVEISYNEDIVDNLKLDNDKIINYKNALIDDQLESINDERNLKNIQIEFLKIYSDYDNISHKIECLKSGQLKKTRSGKKGEASQNNLAEIEKCLLEEKNIIESTKIKLSEERANIEEEKQNIREERELFDAQRISLLEEKESIIEENRDIINENLYLNRELLKLKKELSSQKDSASLEEELKSLKEQYNDVKEKLKNSVETNNELSAEISKMMDKEETIWAYKIQVETQQAEFHQMHQAEQNYLAQIDNLSTEIRQLRQQNARLRQRNNEEDCA